MRKPSRLLVMLALLLPFGVVILRAADGAHQPRIVLAGDSTMATRTGWGDALGPLLAPGVDLVNMAKGGRSSKSFRDEGWWEKVLAEKPDWILIQFGHNDMPGKGPERETDPETTFRENLIRYVKEARAIGARPVLVTSLTRRNFGPGAKIDPEHLQPLWNGEEGSTLPDALNGYVVATREVAAELDVPLIDLNARSIEQLNKMGPEAAKAYDRPGKTPDRPDTTHLSAVGAAATAKLVAGEIRANIPDLAKLLR